MLNKMKVSTKRVLGVLALLIVVFGVYTLGMSAGEKKEESKVVTKKSVTAESGVESDSSDVQVDVEPSPDQVEAAEAESEEYSDESDPTPTQKYFSLMRNVFIKYEDKFGMVVEMNSSDDDTITIETDRANFVVDLVVSEGYAYITNMDTAEKNRYPLPEE